MLPIPKLEAYNVDPNNGFMRFYAKSDENFPEKFSLWNDLAENSEKLIKEKKLRNSVDQMPMLDHQELKTETQKLYAYTRLCFIGNGYIWQEGENGKPEKIPQKLAIPWAGLASEVGLKPCHTYVSTVIGNMTLKDPSQPASIENMAAMFFTPGGKESEWFFVVSAATEIEGAPGLRAMLSAMEGVRHNDDKKVLAGLKELNTSIKNVHSRALARMHEGLTPKTFYDYIRNFLNGWSKPGIIFEGVDEDYPISVIGASAAQSPLIHCFDAALRVTHKRAQQSYLESVRRYMLPKHQAFIKALWDGPNTREFVQTVDSPKLNELYNECVDSLVNIRDYNHTAVRKWIVEPAGDRLAKSTGANIEAFLASIKETTASHKI